MPLVGVIGLIVVGVVVVGAGVALVGSYRLTRQLLTPQRKPYKQRPEDVGLAMEDVRVAGPRGALAGWYLPARNGCTLICLHGIHDNRAQWLEQVARLHTRNGYGALLLDFAGHGQSDAAWVTYGVRETEDVAAAVAYLRERGDVDMTRLGVMGYSLGAITATLAAARMPELRTLVIESGFADVEHDLALLFRRFTGLPAFPFANLVVFWGQRLAGVRLSQIRPVAVIGRISPRATLIISDLRDGLANEPEDGKALFAAAGAPKELWQVAEATHVAAFQARPDEWIERVGDFLEVHLAGAQGRTQGGARTGQETRDATGQAVGAE